MDATVDDFFNEINQISTKNDLKEQLEEVWQECLDKLTGYSYFWNTENDEVTWVPPKSYKPADDSRIKNIPPKPDSIEKGKKLSVPPAYVSAPQNTSTSVNPETKSKVYSIQEAVINPHEKKGEFKSTLANSSTKPVSSPVRHRHRSERKLPFKRPEDSDEDEKIELITEYGGDSDSDESAEIIQKNLAKQEANPIDSIRKVSLVGQTSAKRITKSTSNKVLPLALPSKEERSLSDEEDEDNDIDLLAKIQQRAQELKQLGGKVPLEVKKIIETTDLKKSKPLSAFSLVAGYNSGSSEDEYEPQGNTPTIPIFPVAPIPETGHSTLFPATKPIDVKDFIVPEPFITSDTAIIDIGDNDALTSDFDPKAFQRKKRIGVSLVNNVKRPKGDIEDLPKIEFAGFGFKSENSKNGDAEPEASSIYPGSQKGGLMFVKSDVLQPAAEEKYILKEDNEENNINKKETEEDYKILREKLLFLGEGRQPVLPVQAMLIQAETLFLAMKEGGLKLSYLFKWLREMCSELINLEKEAAPEGWLLQWDRSQKRYFYQNQASGVSQWHYPEPDVTRCDDAMDISTTPPPPDNIKAPKVVEPIVFGPQLLLVDPPLPPSPPNIRSPTPPPPPIISICMDVNQILPGIPDVPLPPDPQPVVPLPPLPPLNNDQPLPPGVDLLPEAYNKTKKPAVKANDTLNTALDSFYSEIAEVAENTNSRSPAHIYETPIENAQLDVLTSTEAVRKKKKKGKLAQGLTMKKKAVSQLVEKWKNVQKNYSV